jgi:hypothetical protein
MDSSSSWIDIDTPEDTPCCPMPMFMVNTQPPVDSVSGMQRALRITEAKAELHRVLQAMQCSSEFGVYLCESFRDPRRHYIDDYWQDVCKEAIGVEEMHKLVGKVDDTPLPEEARVRFHQLARLLERLARRIDRVVLG